MATFAQEKILQDQWASARRKRAVANSARCALVDSLRSSFGLNYLVQRITIWAMKQTACDHGSPDTRLSYYPGKLPIVPKSQISGNPGVALARVSVFAQPVTPWGALVVPR